jgi:hypothetical protein
MPWQDLLSPAQRAQVLALPASLREFEDLYTLTPADREFVTAHRTHANRLGVALQLCFLRYPGRAWTPEELVPAAMLRFIALQVGAEPADLLRYAKRDQTRRAHALAVVRECGFTTFDVRAHGTLSTWLTEQARSTDNGVALVSLLIAEIRRRRIVVPTLPVVERLALACRARARREAYATLGADLTPEHRQKLDGLLDPRGDTRQTHLGWVRQSLGGASPTNIRSCLERLTFLRSLDVPVTWSARVHPNRLKQIAREGASTDVAHLRTFGPARRYATLVAAVLDAMTVLTDEALEMHERVLGQQFRKAERRHLDIFQAHGKAINDTLKRYAALGRALLDAKTRHADPFAAVERVLPWDELAATVAEAEQLAQPGEFDSLALITNSYPVLRRYAPEFLEAFEFRSTPVSEPLMKAVDLLRALNTTGTRKLPDDAPRTFIRPRWERHVFTSDGLDRRFYEICVLSELGKSLRAGDLSVTGSRRYRDFDEYLLPADAFAANANGGLAAGDRSRCRPLSHAA